MPSSRSSRQEIPHDAEAEAALLGAIIINNDLIWEVMQRLDSNDFYVPQHEVIYRAIVDVAENGSGKIDVVSLRRTLEDRGELKEAGGAVMLSSLIDSMPSAANAESYLNIILKDSMSRRLIATSRLLADPSADPRERAEKVLEEIILSLSGRAFQETSTVSEAAKKYLAERDDGLEGRWVETGIRPLDNFVTMRKGNVVVVAGHPRTGKSALALQTALNVAKTGHVLFITLEMSPPEIIERIIQGKTGCVASAIEQPQFTTEKMRQEIDRAFAEISGTGRQLHISNSSFLTPQRVLAMGKRLQVRHGAIKLVVVDYLQLMHCPERGLGSVERVTWLSRNMKQVAASLGVPVMLLSQLRRNPAQENREPQLHDLRDSGAIEQDADIVIFTHRPNPDVPEGELICQKQRHGPSGRCSVRFDGARCRFTAIEKGYCLAIPSERTYHDD